MKNKIKKIIAVVLSVLTVCLAFASCSNTASSGKIKVGVIQYASHPSLDNCYKGVEQGLKESGLDIEIDFKNANNDSASADAIAKNMITSGCDMIIGIATPAVVSAYSAAAGNGVPVIFCSVSDPVAAKIVNSLEAPGGNCTGTTDILDFDSQVKLIKAYQPDAKKVGVLYTTSEANSVSQLKAFEQAAAKVGLEVVGQGVQTAADIPQAAATLAGKVDCINNMTDNNVVTNLSVVIEKANDAKIPVYGSEIEQVKMGCIASYSIDYVELGKVTANMAAEVLNGKSAAEMPVQKFSKGTYVANKEVMDKFGIKTPAGFENIQFVETAK